MNKIIYILIVLLCGLWSQRGHAQYDLNYTHFVFNKMAYNPAYAGSRDALTLGAIYRHQWQGIDGAPRTGSVYAHLPFWGKRSGLGVALTNDRIGMVDMNMVTANYAYRIKAGDKGSFALGLSGSLEFTEIEWNKADIRDINDPEVPNGPENYSNPNFGVGMFYQNPAFFVGISVPRLLKNGLFEGDFYNQQDITRLRSYYGMLGANLNLGAKVLLRPSALVSMSPNAPLDVDLNASFLFANSLWIGASYRLDDSVDALIQYQFTPQFKAGIAYDFTLSELNNHTTGSAEILIEYTFRHDDDGLQHIRFF